MKKLSRILAGCLTLLLSISMLSVPAAAATPHPTAFYDAEKAIRYASQHWNDGVGLCASYISRCLAAGGITIVNNPNYYSGNQQSYKSVSGKLGAYTNPATCSAAMLLYLSQQGYEIIANPKETDMAPGDLLFMYGGRFADGHVTMINRTDSSGAYFTAHNNARWDRRVYDLGTFLVKMNGFKDVTSSFAGKRIVISQGNRNLYVLPLSNVLVRGNATDRTHFKVELTQDGWAGLRLDNSRYLTTEKENGTHLRPSATSLKSWECYRLWKRTDGNQYCIQSQATGQFLQVKSGTNLILANTGKITNAAIFNIRIV